MTMRIPSCTMPGPFESAPPAPARGRVSDTRLDIVSAPPLILDDREGGVVVMSETSGRDLRHGNTVITRSVACLRGGGGRTFGCGTVTTPAGAQLHYTFEGWVSARPGPTGGKTVTTAEGTWTLTGGSGPWPQRTGRGVFRTRAARGRVRISDWEGAWE